MTTSPIDPWDGPTYKSLKDHDVHFSFSSPATYFLPSLPATDASTFNPATTNFGLIHQPYTSGSSLTQSQPAPTDWQRFTHHLQTLNTNSTSPPTTTHHILFLSRHGQGYHNLAESYYGTNAWDCHFAELPGDPDPSSNITWLDASLSKLGRQQAAEQHTFWQRQYDVEKMPSPSSWWSSPMERAARTAQITHGFYDEEGKEGHGNKDTRVITIKEFLRETNGIHTCDQRRTRSSIATRFPSFTIEASLTERDELWSPTTRESDAAHTYRAKLLLDDILASNSAGSYLSLTAHGGMINALLRAVGHREFTVPVGSAIAVYVIAERGEGGRRAERFGGGGGKPKCIGDPSRAGLPGFKSLREYVDSIEGAVVSG